MRREICNIFAEVRCGFSADRVVADPDLNGEFITHCRRSGLTASDADLNIALLNLRKAGLLKGQARSRRTSFREEGSYRYASEVAARHLERREMTTLDRIICDPALAQEFDQIATSIAPGFSPLQYRWAALNLRKSRSLRPELLSHVVRPTGIRMGKIEAIQCNELPMQQGLYVFYGPSETLYVGEAANLQRRIAKHLDHSDNKNLAKWFWEHGFRDVHLEIQTLNEDVPTKVRRALEAELILSRHPIFNVKQVRSDDV